jgi:hypothetical protein
MARMETKEWKIAQRREGPSRVVHRPFARDKLENPFETSLELAKVSHKAGRGTSGDRHGVAFAEEAFLNAGKGSKLNVFGSRAKGDDRKPLATMRASTLICENIGE